MIINVEGVDVEQQERVYIKQEGEITLKVVKVTEGKTQNQNPQIKVHFQDRNGLWAIDDFVITPNALWKIKTLTKALKLPNVVDTNLFTNRYVKATLKAKNTQGGGVIYEIKKYEQSRLTNTYEPPQTQSGYQVQYNDANSNSISQEQFNQNQQNAQNAQGGGQQQMPINDNDEILF